MVASGFAFLTLGDFYFFSGVFIFFFSLMDDAGGTRAHVLSRDLQMSKKSCNFAEDLETTDDRPTTRAGRHPDARVVAGRRAYDVEISRLSASNRKNV